MVRHRGFFVFSFALRAHRIVGYERDVISDIATGVTVLHKLFQLQRHSSLVLGVVSPCHVMSCHVMSCHVMPSVNGHRIEHGETQQKTRYA